ncbi:MAG: serine/threonine protein phosphatase [Deltaproteobacteria bacterium]|nr:serine/threonine protein phosphatase [Deltaproteobacteria bacterium]
MGKIFAIGDIHGCRGMLVDLIKKINPAPTEDTLVFIGDYIDRGRDSKGVVDLIIDIKKTVKNVVCLKGNHESMFLNYYLHGVDEMLFLENGGRETLLSYGDPGLWYEKRVRIPENHEQFFKALQLYYETDEYIFVHAGLRPGIPLEKQDEEDMLWIRREFIDSSYNFGKRVVFGHTPMPGLRIDKTKIGIDTGAVYGGKLTCIMLPDMEIFQV